MERAACQNRFCVFDERIDRVGRDDDRRHVRRLRRRIRRRRDRVFEETDLVRVSDAVDDRRKLERRRIAIGVDQASPAKWPNAVPLAVERVVVDA